MSYFPPFGYSKQKIEIELDFSNDGRKFDLKNTTGVGTSKFPKKIDLANLKPEVDLLDFDNKLCELDANKLKAVHIDLKKLSDAVDKKLVKKDVYNAKIRDVEDKIPDIATLVSAAKTNKLKLIRLKVKYVVLLTQLQLLLLLLLRIKYLKLLLTWSKKQIMMQK